jgi:hypothetical protein
MSLSFLLIAVGGVVVIITIAGILLFVSHSGRA